MTENWQIPDMSLEGVWFVDMGAVRVEDLERARPGSIIRCHYLPAVQYVPTVETYERFAGLISDAA